MAQPRSPLATREVLQMSAIGIQPQHIRFGKVSCGSERFITVLEDNGMAVIETSSGNVTRLPVPVDSAIMNPVSRVLALRKFDGKGTTALQIYNMEMKTKMKNAAVPAQVIFWKWLNSKTIALVTPTDVYHWSMDSSSQPTKAFSRHPTQGNVQIINYRSSADGKWLVLGGVTRGANGSVAGVLQVHSVDIGQSQPTMDSHAACFVAAKLDGRNYTSNLFAFTKLAPSPKLNVLEVGVPKQNALKYSVDLPIAANDFPMAMIPDDKNGMIFIMTKQGALFFYEAHTGTLLFQEKGGTLKFVSSEVSAESKTGGIITIDVRGTVSLTCPDPKAIIPYVSTVLNNSQLGIKLSARLGIATEQSSAMFKQQFAQLLQAGRTQEAVKLAANSPGDSLRTIETINALKQADMRAGGQGGQVVLSYFQLLLAQGSLNAVESVELVKPVLMKGNAAAMEMIKKWISEAKLTPSEDLGDLLKNANIQLALSVYLRANVHEKVISCFLSMAVQAPTPNAAVESFNNVLAYSKKVNFTPDYALLVSQLVRVHPTRAKDFALILLEHADGPKLEITQTVNLFVNQNDIKSATAIILKYLLGKEEKEEDADLQNKVLELNLRAGNAGVVRAILESNDYNFTLYNKIAIAQLCESAGLLDIALNHYTDINDIKRIMQKPQQLGLPFIVQYFGNLDQDKSIDILRDLLRQSVQRYINVAIEVCTEHHEKLGAEAVIQLFEEFQAWFGIFRFLNNIVNDTEDKALVFKYIEAAVALEQIAEVERICRDSNAYDPKEVKEFLLSRNLKDPRPLIHVCDRFGYIEELTQYLYSSPHQLQKFMLAYVQRMQPDAAPKVIGTLLDLNAPEDMIRTLLAGVRPSTDSKDFVERLVDEVERRSRLKLIRSWVEERIKEGSEDPHLHNGLCKIYIDLGISPQTFLRENQFYDSLTIGKYCESRDPHLSIIAYRRANGGAMRSLLTLPTSMDSLRSRPDILFRNRIWISGRLSWKRRTSFDVR